MILSEAGRARFEFGRVTFDMTHAEMSNGRRVTWKRAALGPEKGNRAEKKPLRQ